MVFVLVDQVLRAALQVAQRQVIDVDPRVLVERREDFLEMHRAIDSVLAEKVTAGDLAEEHAQAIGRQVMRDNALELFPQLTERLWKHKGKKLEPATAAK